VADLDHDYLWRCLEALPERGRIGIFNRSYYEEVVVVRVHKELLAKQKVPPALLNDGTLWRDRFEDIRNVEQYLSRNGTLIRKFLSPCQTGARLRSITGSVNASNPRSPTR
jgi:polyphosphate kinase 2 (PPK2 family)